MQCVTVPIKAVSVANLREQVLAAMSYDLLTGVFTRIAKSGPNVVVGAEAGSIDHQGYRRIWLAGRLWAAHRLAWLCVHGEWPKGKIDHINGIRSDNRIANLRDVDHSTNLENQRKARSDNRLGVLGVRLRGSKYEARIWVKGQPIFLGSFETAEKAQEAYVKAKRDMHAGGCSL